MQSGVRPSRELDAYARSFDWHQNIFAPSLHILQALTPRGETASGAGSTRPLAYARCLAEAAEFHALDAAGGKVALGFVARRDGIAAHPDAATACSNAEHEAFERYCVALRWHGQMQAYPLDPAWLESTGATKRIAKERYGAAQRRPTKLWRIESDSQTHVIVCHSSSLRGQMPILGFGCHGSATLAALKALREVMLMELNVMTLQIARHNGSLGQFQTLQDMFASYARHASGLLPDAGFLVPPDDLQSATLPDWFGRNLHLRDISVPDGPMPVWLCQSDQLLPDTEGSAYFQTTDSARGENE